MGQAKIRAKEIAALKAMPELAIVKDAPLADIGNIILSSPAGSQARKNAAIAFFMAEAMKHGGIEAAKQMEQIIKEAAE
jgi:hypothetical protein